MHILTGFHIKLTYSFWEVLSLNTFNYICGIEKNKLNFYDVYVLEMSVRGRACESASCMGQIQNLV